MSVLDILTELEDKLDSEVFERLKKEAESDDSISKKASHKKGQENSGLRNRLRSLEDAIKKLGFEIDDDLESKIDEFISNGSKSKGEANELMKKIDRLQAAFADKEKREIELTKRLNNQKISSELRKALRDGNTVVIEDIEDLIIESYLNGGKAKVSETDGKILFDNNGDEIDLVTEVANYKKANPGRFTVKQKAGSGSSGTDDKNKTKSAVKISATDFNAMPARERAQWANDNPDFELT